MRLYSPQFTKSLRRGVRARIRASPALKREYRRVGRHHLGNMHVRWAMPLIASFFLFAFVAGLASKLERPDAALALIGTIAILMASSREMALLVRLYRSMDLRALSLLPLTPPQIFRWQLEQFLHESLYTLLMLLGAFLGIVFYPGFGAWQILILIPIAVLTWLNILALALFCAVHLRRNSILKIQKNLAVGAPLLFFSLLVVSNALHSVAILQLADRCAPWVLVLLPTAWPASLARLLFPGAGWADLLLLFPTLGIIWTARDSLRSLLSKYEFREVTRPEPPDLVPAAATNSASATNPAASAAAAPSVLGASAPVPARVGPTAIAEIIQSRAFLAPPQWHKRGWFEKMFWRRLTPRERGLSQVIFPDGPRLTAQWKKVFWILAVTVLAGFLVGCVMPMARYWIYAFGIFLALCFALNLTLAAGRAFQFHATGGVLLPAYAYFPMGLREISWILFKLSAVQLPALLAFSLACGLLVLDQFDLPYRTVLIEGVQYGLRATIVFFSLRFAMLVARFSGASNDTQRLRLFVFPLIFLMISFVIVFIALAITGVFVPYESLAWAAAVLAFLEAGLFLLVYGWFYRGNFFDLTRLPRR